MKFISWITLLGSMLACTLGTEITPTLISTSSTQIGIPTRVKEMNIPNATIVYYDIAGSTEIELRQQLDLLSPTGYDNYKGDSTTNWHIYWTWLGYGSSTCDLTKPEVTYTIEVIMPRWVSSQDTSPEVIIKWNNYMKALTEHEKGHVDFVVENYKSVEEAIKNATCETAEAAAQEALISIRQHDIDYDVETDHGATQGARFP